MVAKQCLLLCFQPGASQLLYQVIKAHTIRTIMKELHEVFLLAQKLSCLCHLQYSGNSERAKGILQLAKFSESLSFFEEKYPTSP